MEFADIIRISSSITTMLCMMDGDDRVEEQWVLDTGSGTDIGRRGLGQGGRALQRRVRESVLEEEQVRQPRVAAGKRRPFAPWAGK